MNEDMVMGEFVDRRTLRLVRHFSHPPQQVWEALTDAAQVTVWFLPCTLLEPRAGGRYAFESDGKSWSGVIGDFEPPHLIDFGGWLRFELSEAAGGCRLVLTLKRTRAGWSPMTLAGFHGWLGRLQRHVDGIAPEQADDWASNHFSWDGLFLAYERLLRRDVTGGAKVVYRIHFESNLADLNSDAKLQLDELAGLMRRSPDLRVCVDGFGDDPCSPEQGLELSRTRVAAASQYLQRAGILSERIEMGFALGNYHFLVPSDTEAGRAFNRRVELRPIY
jgi:outer membrane protein OmpA-like peptidoglycan-associated protein/uncharacterized protein YndB with AHSA1/START domain